METPFKPPVYLTDEEVRTIRANLTMLEILRARQSTQDRTEVALRAYWLTAMKVLELPANERGGPKDQAAFEAFLGRLRSEAFQRITEEASPLGSGGPSEPGSSGSTDTDPATS